MGILGGRTLSLLTLARMHACIDPNDVGSLPPGPSPTEPLPVRVYHGSRAPIAAATQLRLSSVGTVGRAVYFSESREDAQEWGSHVVLALLNPRSVIHFSSMSEAVDGFFTRCSDVPPTSDADSWVATRFISEGYDAACICRHSQPNEWAVFRPEIILHPGAHHA